MFYDYLIWNGWPSIYVWVVFFAVVLIYSINKYDLSIQNLTDSRLNKFLIGFFVFVLFYVFIYDPYPKVIQSIFLIPVNVVPSISLSFNFGPIFGLILFLGACMGLYYVYKATAKYLSKKIPAILPAKK